MNNALTSPLVKTLQFPASSLGRVYVSDPLVGERFVAEASGTLVVPAAARVTLKVNADSVRRLGELSSLSPSDLDGLSVAGTAILDVDLEDIAILSGLRSLSIEFTRIDGSVFAKLGALKQLQTVTGWWSRMHDGSVQHLTRLASIESIDLSRTRITSKGVASLQALPNLRILALLHTKIDNEAASALARIHSLECLHLDETDIGDECVPALLALPSLKTLTLQNTRVSEPMLRRIQLHLTGVATADV